MASDALALRARMHLKAGNRGKALDDLERIMLKMTNIHLLAGKPIRASRQSAEWCRRAVDVCWQAKFDRIRPSERDEAKAAYD